MWQDAFYCQYAASQCLDNHKVVTKPKNLHVFGESLLEGIKQHSLQSLLSRTEQSFSLPQLPMAARNNYGALEQKKGKQSSCVLNVPLVTHIAPRKNHLGWKMQCSPKKRVKSGEEDSTGDKGRPENIAGCVRYAEGLKLQRNCAKKLISTTNYNFVLSATTSSKNLQQDTWFSALEDSSVVGIWLESSLLNCFPTPWPAQKRDDSS